MIDEMKMVNYTYEELESMVEKIAGKLGYKQFSYDLPKITFIEVDEYFSNNSTSIIIKGVDSAAVEKALKYAFYYGNTAELREKQYKKACEDMFGRSDISPQFILSVIQFINRTCRHSSCCLLSHWMTFLYE